MKLAGYHIIYGNPLACTDPQIIGAVFGDYIDKIMRERVGILQNVSKHFEVITIVPVKSVISAKPHKTIVILENTPDGIIGEATVDIQPADRY
jgi:hypothetical protein